MPPSINAKSAKPRFSVQVKSLGEDGSFEGQLAVYNNVDLGGDSILPGAFTKTIQERGSEIPLLWQHKTDEPIGTLTLVDSATALNVKGQLLMALPEAKKAYILLKARVIKGMSIGFDTIKASVENGVRQLKEVRLWEGSIVTFPMNESAMVTSIKSLGGAETKDDFNTELAEVQLQDAGWQMRCALFQALGSLVWASGVTKDDKVTAAQTIIEQFSEAFLGYLPQYLDWLSAEYGDMELMGKLRMEEKSFGAALSRKAKGLVAPLELKEGKKFSASTLKSMKEAHEHVKSADDIFNALFDDEADDDPENPAVDDLDDDTPKSGPAAKETKTEPVEDHSEETQILGGILSLIPKK
jgi:HK97 family phage prohead protease